MDDGQSPSAPLSCVWDIRNHVPLLWIYTNIFDLSKGSGNHSRGLTFGMFSIVMTFRIPPHMSNRAVAQKVFVALQKKSRKQRLHPPKFLVSFRCLPLLKLRTDAMDQGSRRTKTKPTPFSPHPPILPQPGFNHLIFILQPINGKIKSYTCKSHVHYVNTYPLHAELK